MQIFVLNKNPKISAFLLFSIDFKRANKQILELGQILSTTAKLKYNIKNKILYKACFVHHPIVLWTQKCDINFLWSLNYLKELLNLFLETRHKNHKTISIYNTILSYKNKKLKNVFKNKLINSKIIFCRCMSNDNYDKNIFKAYKQYIFNKILNDKKTKSK